MKTPEGLLYHPEHTWARVEGRTAVVGITDFAQKELGDIVYVDLPAVGAKMASGKVFGTIESSKSVSELIGPADGEVVEVNAALEDSPEKINDDPYGGGWLVKIALAPGADLGALLDAAAYAGRIAAE